jgi:two-component system CheB/CheR fusion protein
MVVADDEVIRTHEAMHYRLEKRLRSDGGERWDLATRMPLTDRESRIVGVIGIFRDVTEQKHAEEKIRDAVRRRDQFLAMLSHELRNPLNSILTSTQMLKLNGPPTTKQEKYVDILERQSVQMARLLDDLLEASRVTQNKIELRRSTLDLRRTLREAADAVRGFMDTRGIEFTLEDEGEPLTVNGDPARLQQVHVNLLSNAAKYTPRGGHVVLTAVREGTEAVVRVRDDGAGIPKEMLDSVFDLFVQSARTLDRSQGGLGVGLTLVRSLVAMHDGVVVANSDGEGKGSEFVVRIPLTSKRAPEEAAPGRPHLPKGGSRVVIVEDSTDSCEMLAEYLTSAGFECKTAESGVDGLHIIEETRPDWAVIDVGLPGMDGLEVARRIRQNPELDGVYLIALTGYGQPADRMAAHAAGFNEHLVKPVPPDRLLALLAGSHVEVREPLAAPN